MLRFLFWQVVLRCLDVSVSDVFYTKARQFGIDLVEVSLSKILHR